MQNTNKGRRRAARAAKKRVLNHTFPHKKNLVNVLNVCDEWWRWRYNWTTSATGGRGGTGGQGGRGGNGADGNDGGHGGPGGKGGEGGAGGLAGDVFVVGAEMRPIVNKVGGKGGVGGFGGIGITLDRSRDKDLTCYSLARDKLTEKNLHPYGDAEDPRDEV